MPAHVDGVGDTGADGGRATGRVDRAERDSSRRRRYSPNDVALLRTLARLRRTGMPTREMREFTRLVTEGPAAHGQRLALLTAHRERIVTRLAEPQDDLAVLEKKVEHYRYLIEQGLDCDTEHFATRAQACAKVVAWIDDFNRRRRHSALQMMSLVDYEQALAAGQAA